MPVWFTHQLMKQLIINENLSNHCRSIFLRRSLSLIQDHLSHTKNPMIVQSSSFIRPYKVPTKCEIIHKSQKIINRIQSIIIIMITATLYPQYGVGMKKSSLRSISIPLNQKSIRNSKGCSKYILQGTMNVNAMNMKLSFHF